MGNRAGKVRPGGKVLHNGRLMAHPALVDARFANQVVVRPYPDERGQNAPNSCPSAIGERYV